MRLGERCVKLPMGAVVGKGGRNGCGKEGWLEGGGTEEEAALTEGAEGGRHTVGVTGCKSAVSSSLSISISPTSVRSSLQEGSEVAVCWARSSSFWRALSFSRQLASWADSCLCLYRGRGTEEENRNRRMGI